MKQVKENLCINPDVFRILLSERSRFMIKFADNE